MATAQKANTDTDLAFMEVPERHVNSSGSHIEMGPQDPGHTASLRIVSEKLICRQQLGSNSRMLMVLSFAP
jgi:hypothetical protein